MTLRSLVRNLFASTVIRPIRRVPHRARLNLEVFDDRTVPATAIGFTLQATSGSQFGVTAPATVAGTFEVDDSFLAQADGNYGGGAITGFHMQIGTQVYDQATA